MTLSWPTTRVALLIWSQLLLGWTVAMYYLGRIESSWGRADLKKAPWLKALVRLALLILLTLVLAGWSRLAVWLILTAATLGTALIWARHHEDVAWKARGAQVEVGVTLAYVAISALIVGDRITAIAYPLLRLPMSEGRIAALCFTAAIVGFLERGGTQIVRAILNRAGSLPHQVATVSASPEETVPSPDGTTGLTETVDEKEYNRGRLIGSIERLLLAAMVAAGSYAALAFTIAAKGLVRSRKFDDADFAEYFLIGTLASTSLAMMAGGLLRLVYEMLW